jgi:hypothetical protein
MGVPYEERGPQQDGYGGYPQGNGPGSSANPMMPSVNPNFAAYNPETASLPRAESPPPLPGSEPEPSAIGRAVEMDNTAQQAPRGYGQYGQLRDSDIDVAGMVNLQQGQMPGSSPSRGLSPAPPPPGRHDTLMTEGSKYSTDEYVPPRAAWNQGAGRESPRQPSPLHIAKQAPGPPAPISESYYEDVDPRFAGPSTATPPQPPPIEPIYEDVHALHNGARSPAESEKSNFTSISQRGINPRWNPPPPMPHNAPQRRQVQKRHDMLLDMPDFQIPGASGGSQRAGGPGMIPGSAYPPL